MYIAVGPFCWGRSESLKTAIDNCRREYPSKGTTYYQGAFRCVVFHTTDPNARVDDMGGLVYMMGHEPSDVMRVGKFANGAPPKAMLMRADGTVAGVVPKNGKKFTLEELQEFVGGFIELVPGSKETYCNEEGRLRGLPVNDRASKEFNQLITGDVIVVRR